MPFELRDAMSALMSNCIPDVIALCESRSFLCSEIGKWAAATKEYSRPPFRVLIWQPIYVLTMGAAEDNLSRNVVATNRDTRGDSGTGRRYPSPSHKQSDEELLKKSFECREGAQKQALIQHFRPLGSQNPCLDRSIHAAASAI
jgi:hypothetical protein